MCSRVQLLSLMEGARQAAGVTVIVDVFRAMTTAAVALAGGVARLFFVPDVEEALRLRAAGVGDLCVGEIDGRPPAGFDYGNSPHELQQAELKGRRVILSTRAGTAGLRAARGAEGLFTGAFVNLSATAAAVRARGASRVSVVAMGWNASERTDEDELCALALRQAIEGGSPDLSAAVRLARRAREAQKFGDPARPWFHAEDLDLALDADRYDFAIEVREEDGLLTARRKEVRHEEGGL